MEAGSFSSDAQQHFTCVGCRVRFTSADMQRSHFRSDWHSYNLRRKIAGLAPISEELFNTRAASFSNTGDEKNAAEQGAISGKLLCEVCHGKTFSSENSYENHKRSKAHLANVDKKAKSKLDSTEVKELVQEKQVVEEKEEKNWADALDDNLSGEEDDIPSYDTNKCLFCDEKCESIEKNLDHMCREHGFYIPDIDACVEVDCLVEYLGQKISYGRMCIWCQAAHFNSCDAVRKHMQSKGHCKMSRDCWEEYEDFYDFSLLSDEEEGELHVATDVGHELIMPSGNKAGHRSLKHIYRQKLHENTQASNSLAMVARINSNYQMLGIESRNISKRAAERAIARKAMIEQNKMFQQNRMKVGMKSNATLQKHYRDPTMTFG